jgi:hypothetical protein
MMFERCSTVIAEDLATDSLSAQAPERECMSTCVILSSSAFSGQHIAMFTVRLRGRREHSRVISIPSEYDGSAGRMKVG